jgi:hypothetical protein
MASTNGRKRASASRQAQGNAPTAGSSSTETSPPAETRKRSPDVTAPEPEAGQGKTATRRRAARGIEQLLLLSVAIILGLVGFAVHVLWIGAVVLMALLWGYIASGLESSRRRGGVISDVATTVVVEARNLTKEVSNATREAEDDSARSATPDSATAADGPGGALDQPEDVEPQSKSPGEEEATKKELYEEAREAGIEGRSNMSKAELKEALDE